MAGYFVVWYKTVRKTRIEALKDGDRMPSIFSKCPPGYGGTYQGATMVVATFPKGSEVADCCDHDQNFIRVLEAVGSEIWQTGLLYDHEDLEPFAPTHYTNNTALTE